MSNDTTTPTSSGPASQDPGRFSRPQQRPATNAGSRLGAALMLLALVIGVPVGLFLLAGTEPFPTSLPDRETLTSQITFETLLNLLVLVVWFAWLFFLVCVLVEIGAARRGGLARPVPLGGPVQKLARALVGALLFTGVVAGPAAHAGAPASVPSGAHLSSAVVAVDAAAQQVAPDLHEEEAALGGSAADQLAGKLIYTVAAPKDGYHDNLWDIAERHLGDGRRYTEIFELNQGLEQPDGRELELARLIQPGWTLVMPEDAVGVERMLAAPTQSDADRAAAQAGAGAQSTVDLEAQDAVEDGMSGGGMLGAGLLAAAALGALALERRRRIGAAAAAREVEADLRGAATPDRAAYLDRSLRDLAAAVRGAEAVLPPVYAVTVDDASIELHLAPPTPATVGEWTTADEGRTWRRGPVEDREELRRERSPYPALVSLGLDEAGRDVLVDLEAAGGPVSITGDPATVSEVAASIAIQGATASWADTVRVSAAGLPPGLEGIGDDRVSVVADLAEVLPEIRAELSGRRTDVLTGRLHARRSFSRMVVAGSAPSQDVLDQLSELVSGDRQALSVVVADRHPGATWQLTVDDAGNLRLPELGISVRANRLGVDQVAGIAELFAAAREPDRPDDGGGQIAVPQPARLVDDAAWSTADRRVGVLGAIAVTGVDEEADRAEQAREIVVFLALQPEPVHPSVLAAALWPRGVTPDVSAAAIERARDWLGDDASGNAYLREDPEGRLSLSDKVVCDWDALRTLLIRARQAADRDDEVAGLRRALQLVRGRAFADAPGGRYGWLALGDHERVIRRVVVASAHRLAELLGDDDPHGAAGAARAGLRLDLANQELWRDVLRSSHAAAGVAGVRKVVDEIGPVLRGVPLEPETQALIEEYLPSEHGTAAYSSIA